MWERVRERHHPVGRRTLPCLQAAATHHWCFPHLLHSEDVCVRSWEWQNQLHSCHRLYINRDVTFPPACSPWSPTGLSSAPKWSQPASHMHTQREREKSHLTSWWSQTLTPPAWEHPAMWRLLHRPLGRTCAPVPPLSACFCCQLLSGSPVAEGKRRKEKWVGNLSDHTKCVCGETLASFDYHYISLRDQMKDQICNHTHLTGEVHN